MKVSVTAMISIFFAVNKPLSSAIFISYTDSHEHPSAVAESKYFVAVTKWSKWREKNWSLDVFVSDTKKKPEVQGKFMVGMKSYPPKVS